MDFPCLKTSVSRVLLLGRLRTSKQHPALLAIRLWLPLTAAVRVSRGRLEIRFERTRFSHSKLTAGVFGAWCSSIEWAAAKMPDRTFRCWFHSLESNGMSGLKHA